MGSLKSKAIDMAKKAQQNEKVKQKEKELGQKAKDKFKDWRNKSSKNK